MAIISSGGLVGPTQGQYQQQAGSAFAQGLGSGLNQAVSNASQAYYKRKALEMQKLEQDWKMIVEGADRMTDGNIHKFLTRNKDVGMSFYKDINKPQGLAGLFEKKKSPEDWEKSYDEWVRDSIPETTAQWQENIKQAMASGDIGYAQPQVQNRYVPPGQQVGINTGVPQNFDFSQLQQQQQKESPSISGNAIGSVVTTVPKMEITPPKPLAKNYNPMDFDQKALEAARDKYTNEENDIRYYLSRPEDVASLMMLETFPKEGNEEFWGLQSLDEPRTVPESGPAREAYNLFLQRATKYIEEQNKERAPEGPINKETTTGFEINSIPIDTATPEGIRVAMQPIVKGLPEGFMQALDTAPGERTPRQQILVNRGLQAAAKKMSAIRINPGRNPYTGTMSREQFVNYANKLQQELSPVTEDQVRNWVQTGKTPTAYQTELMKNHAAFAPLIKTEQYYNDKDIELAEKKISQAWDQFMLTYDLDKEKFAYDKVYKNSVLGMQSMRSLMDTVVQEQLSPEQKADLAGAQAIINATVLSAAGAKSLNDVDETTWNELTGRLYSEDKAFRQAWDSYVSLTAKATGVSPTLIETEKQLGPLKRFLGFTPQTFYKPGFGTSTTRSFGQSDSYVPDNPQAIDDLRNKARGR